MHADVEIAALAILLAERCPPEVEHPLRVGDALRRVLAAEPGEAEEHRVVDHIVERQMDKAIRAAFVDDVMRALIGRALGPVHVSVFAQQRSAVPAARADRPAAADLFDCGDRLGEVILFEARLLRDAVLPHVIGDFVAALDRGAQCLRIELAGPPRGEDRRLDMVRVKQLDQPPDADPATELALCQLHRRLVQQPPQQHRVEIEGEIDRDPHPRRPAEIGDVAVPSGIGPGGLLQLGEIPVELADHQLASGEQSSGTAIAQGAVFRIMIITPEEDADGPDVFPAGQGKHGKKIASEPASLSKQHGILKACESARTLR